ncbi:hypothetical protein ASF10_06725 [Flavobacterium sp. Leaf82]|uniref:hypothetical protein n=1 Tax=unclassified Flavobacterium TaxID=196869 RepID=UPI0006FA1032|nr:hypothetical protein [Flavobacterium sp. Leaf82]KQO24864.1 hypothetical protein ASF10_06725 [Flavobacterium sp. Leaf82]
MNLLFDTISTNNIFKRVLVMIINLLETFLDALLLHKTKKATLSKVAFDVNYMVKFKKSPYFQV